MNLIKIADECRNSGCDIKENVLLSELTSFRIGGPADLLVTVVNAEQAERVKEICVAESVPLMFLGNGSNLLVSDKGIRGVILRFDCQHATPALSGDTIICPAGVLLKNLCRFSRENGLSGLEFAYGIPGTVGGAVYMNAGAYDGQISDVILWADVLLPDGNVKRLNAKELNLSYRYSVIMENRGIVTAAAFRLTSDKVDEIGKRMEEFMRRRREKQPLEFPSAGSFFKRPKGYYAGSLIESCGLKGFQYGGAQVSEKHAGFIINKGGATCSDVRNLADNVIERVYLKHGVRLEQEVCFAGEE